MVVLVSWFLLSVVLITLGKLCDNKALLGIGATMILMMAMVSNVSY